LGCGACGAVSVRRDFPGVSSTCRGAKENGRSGTPGEWVMPGTERRMEGQTRRRKWDRQTDRQTENQNLREGGRELWLAGCAAMTAADSSTSMADADNAFCFFCSFATDRPRKEIRSESTPVAPSKDAYVHVRGTGFRDSPAPHKSRPSVNAPLSRKPWLRGAQHNGLAWGQGCERWADWGTFGPSPGCCPSTVSKKGSKD
jgi:hypothetical protein